MNKEVDTYKIFRQLEEKQKRANPYKFYDKDELIDEILKSEDEIERLKEELKSANESITWWSNRYKAIEHLYRYTPEKGFELVGDEE